MNFLRNLIQGTHSASKTDTGQKKKGAPPAPGAPESITGDTPATDDVCVTQPTTPATDDVCVSQPFTSVADDVCVSQPCALTADVCVSQPCALTADDVCITLPCTPATDDVRVSQPPTQSLPSPDLPTPGSAKESDTASATEETSFASCLTGEPTSEGSVPSTTPSSESAKILQQEPDVATVSVSDSLAQSFVQNGVKKDSEYESAEELESTTKPSQQSSEGPTGAAPSAEQDTRVTPDAVICQEGKGPEGFGVSCNNDQTDSLPNNVPSTISESFVTVTKSEIVEETVSVKPDAELETPGNTEPSEIIAAETVAVKLDQDPPGNFESLHGEKQLNEETLESGKDKTELNVLPSNESLVSVQNDGKCDTDAKTSCSEVSDSASSGSTEPPALKSLDNTGSNSLTVTNIKGSDSFENEPVEQAAITADPEDLPITPQKAYNLDFLDNLDDPNFNPFASKTAIRNTPPPSPEPGQKLPPLKPVVRKKKAAVNANKSPEKKVENIKEADNSLQEASIGPVDNKPVTNDTYKTVENLTKAVPEKQPENSSSSQPEAVEDKSNNNPDQQGVLLDISLDDQPKTQTRPPRKLGQRPPPRTKQVKKPVETNNNSVEDQTIPAPEVKAETEEDLPIPPSKGYNLDFLDNIDDPNFNPFSTSASISNSPPKEGFVPPEAAKEPESKPKAKVVTPRKVQAKKGFSVSRPKPKRELSNADEVDAPNKGVTNVNQNTADNAEEEVIEIPKKAYNLDFLDDPNFDPFKTRQPVDGEASIQTKDEVKEDPNANDNQSVTKANQSEEKPSEESQAEAQIKSQVVEPKPQITEVKPLSLKAEQNIVEVAPEDIEINLQEEAPSRTEINQVIESKPQVAKVEPLVVEVKPSEEAESVHPKEHQQSGDDLCSKKQTIVETENIKNEINQNCDKYTSGATETAIPEATSTSKDFHIDILSDTSLPKVPSIGGIGQLDSLEFAQLLGNEASKLAEEFMNCSSDSGLPEADDSNSVKCSNDNMSHLDDSANPFLRSSRMARSPPLGKRGAVCGAESADLDVADPFKPRRALRREDVLGEDRQENSSFDDDSGIVIGTRSDLEPEVNHSEAGPEIATGLTSMDLRCASQCLSSSASTASLFKEASDLEKQYRKHLSTPYGSQSKLSVEDVTPIKEKPEHRSITPESPHNKPSTSTPAPPPREERSAPEGTSSPTPRPSDTSERKSLSRPHSSPPDGFMSTIEVEDLLKRQSLQFEEKLLRFELAANEKENKLVLAMKEEQKEKGSLGGSVQELTQSRDALLKMVGQYKGMLAQLVGEKEKEKQGAEERIRGLETERSQALDDLGNVETAFSDVHRKYERTKQVVDTLRRNEETLRTAITDYESKLQKQEQKFVEFQKHAEEKIQLANEEFETMRKANDTEMTKMAALLKKAEMKIVSLQDSIDRKSRENTELTQLCDDLISKVGGN